jgi:hypothetical protein
MSEKHTVFYKWWLTLKFWVKLILFEKCFSLYKFFFGFLEVKFDDQNKVLEEGAPVATA